MRPWDEPGAVETVDLEVIADARSVRLNLTNLSFLSTARSRHPGAVAARVL